MTSSQKRICALLTFVAFISIPLPADAQRRSGGGMVGDWCKFARGAETLAAMTAFGLGFIPALQPIAVIYGVVAIGAKTYVWARCE